MHRKKLLIIGAGDFQLPLVQEAAKTCDVVLAAPVISPAFAPYICARLLCDVRDEEKILAFAQSQQIDGVITDQTDIAVRSVAYVAEKMGLPGIGTGTGLLFTDKSRMRARMKELGIRQLENRTVSSLEEALAFYRELDAGISPEKMQAAESCPEAGAGECTSEPGAGACTAERGTGECTSEPGAGECGPDADPEFLRDPGGEAKNTPPGHVRVIIKPLDTQGSRGVQVCACEEELRAKYAEAARWSSNQRDVLIEQFATGREFVVESLVLDYEYHSLCIGDTLYFDIPDAFAAKSRIFPTTADAALRSRVLALDEKIIRGFGLRQGITHSEYIMQGDEVYLIETAARGGGVFISSDLIRLSSGLHTEQFLINIALGQQREFPQILPQQLYCGYMAFYLPVGRVIRADGIDAVKALPFVHHTQLDKLRTGMENREGATDKTSRLAIIVSGETRTALMDHMAEVRAALQIEIKAPDGTILGPIWE